MEGVKERRGEGGQKEWSEGGRAGDTRGRDDELRVEGSARAGD